MVAQFKDESLLRKLKGRKKKSKLADWLMGVGLVGVDLKENV
jgi:hypothetical protein